MLLKLTLKDCHRSSLAENTDGPTLTSGGAAVITLATAWPLATAGACVGAACYLAYKATKDPHDAGAYHVDNENPASGGDAQSQPNQPVIPTSENKGIIKQHLDPAELFEKHKDHVFSDDHIKRGIEQLGNSRPEIVSDIVKIVKEVDHQGCFREGWNRIQTFINGHKAEIRIRIENGNLLSLNAFKNWSSRKGNIIHFP